MKKLLSFFFLLAIIGNAQLSTAENLVQNGDFEDGSTEWITLIGPISTPVSAFDSWSSWATYKPSAGAISTRLFHQFKVEGMYSGRVKTKIPGDGIFQYEDRESGVYTMSGWFYAISGGVKMGFGINNGSQHCAYSDPIYFSGQWVYISTTCPNTSGLSGPAIVGTVMNSEFLVDAVWLNSGDTNESPFDPSTGFNPNKMRGDFDFDGDVDGNDLKIFTENYGITE